MQHNVEAAKARALRPTTVKGESKVPIMCLQLMCILSCKEIPFCHSQFMLVCNGYQEMRGCAL